MTEYSNRSRSAEIALEDHEAFLDDPGRFLEHEYFLPGRPNSLASLTFPFSISVVRGAWDWYAREPKDDAPPRYTKFYRADHDSGALALTTAILQAFSSGCVTARADADRGRPRQGPRPEGVP